MNVLEKLKWRYATKKFDPTKKLSEPQLQVLKEAFNLTATSYGLQPVKLLVIADDSLKQRLVEHSWGQRQVADASHLLVFCVINDIDEQYVINYFERVKNIRNTPDEILKPFRSFLTNDFNNKTSEEIKTWATKQAYLAMGNLLTVCALEGIDSCPMEGITPEKYDEVLQLPEKGLSAVLAMPVGFRAQDDMFANFKKVRKDLSESIVQL